MTSGPLDRLACRFFGGDAGKDRPAAVAAARRVAVVTLLLSIVLRLGFAALNLQFNDEHIEVSQVMAYEERIPMGRELWEAFQPKLYHGTVAAGLMLLPERHLPSEIRVANFVSCLAGLVALLALVRFTYGLKVREQLRYQAIVLLALNPALILITTQATNDAFVICFSILTLLAGQRWFRSYRWQDWAWMMLFALLAGFSKGNSVVLPCAIGMTTLLLLGFKRSRPRSWKVALAGAALLVVGFVAVVGLVGPYRWHYEHYGSPFITNLNRQPIPHVWEQTYVLRPGVTSLAHSFLTFRLFDMLREPSVGVSFEEFNPARTSAPSLLYGEAHSIHYACFLSDIRSDAPFVRMVTRAILLLALPITLLMFVELTRRSLAVVVAKAEPGDNSLLLTVACLGFIGFQVVYAIRYRDFSTVKTIFLMPALPGFIAASVHGVERFTDRFGKSSLAGRVVHMCLAWLPMLYLADLFSALASLTLARLTTS